MDTVGIVNLALQKLGTRTTVTAVELATNSSNEAIQANVAIAQTRDELLRLAPWQCARGAADLAYITSLPGTPENQSSPTNQLQWTPGLPLPPWTYEYAYPSDCLRALWIIPQSNPGATGIPVYPTTTTTGYGAMWQGPPIRFDVANDNFYAATAAGVSNGGSGYAIGDLITLALGPVTSPPIGQPAQVQVTGAVGGVITAVTVVASVYGEDVPQSGAYFQPLTAPQAQGSTTGSGTGAVFSLTYTAQGNQRVVLTNQEYAVLSYIRRVTDTNVMDALFVRAWYHILAASMAMSLTGDRAFANNLIQIANTMIQEARAVDGNEALTIHDVTPDFLRVRGTIYSDSWNAGTGYNWDTVGLWPSY